MVKKVFLSSTYFDLKEFRIAVQRIIRQLGAVDLSMENFGARDIRPKKECIRLVKEESDVFVGIYAYRYGHIPKGDRRSIIEAEYNAAYSADLQILIYLVDEQALWCPYDIDKGADAEKLLKFKRKLKSRHICSYYSTPDELASKVAADLGRYISVTPPISPIPGNEIEYLDSLSQLNRLPAWDSDALCDEPYLTKHYLRYAIQKRDDPPAYTGVSQQTHLIRQEPFIKFSKRILHKDRKKRLKGNVFLILGEPGSGKSILAIQLLQYAAGRAYKDRASPLPIYVNLKHFHQEPPNGNWSHIFELLVKRSIENACPRFVSFRQACRSQKKIFFKGIPSWRLALPRSLDNSRAAISPGHP